MRLRPEILKLLDSSIPFLGPSGQQIVRSTQTLAELIQSPVGVKALNTLTLLTAPQPAADAADSTAVKGYNPYSLFLVFYLLILATDHSHPGQSMKSEEDTTEYKIMPLASIMNGEEDPSDVNPT
ncbi:MAG: hypothetical protein GX262_07105 [Clostridia bacterium]|jgi:hypothetical protein|nr:hypothetical protein [Clostridia bacterium]